MIIILGIIFFLVITGKRFVDTTGYRNEKNVNRVLHPDLKSRICSLFEKFCKLGQGHYFFIKIKFW